MTQLVRRVCCNEAMSDAVPQTFYERGSARTLGTGPVIDRIDIWPGRFEHSAWHESGHAVVGLIVGEPIRKATIEVQPNVQWDEGESTSYRARTSAILAGPIAQDWEHRRISRLSDDAWLWSFNRIRACIIGQCDSCQAARIGLVLSGHDLSKAMSWLREVEGAVIDVITSHIVTRSIRSVTAALVAKGTLPGTKVERIISEIIDPATMAELKEKLS